MSDTSSISDDLSSYLNTSSNTSQVDTGSGLDYDDFLTLLTAELTHQDPTNPLDNKELILQLAQFSTLSATSELNKNMSSFISTSTISTVNSMIGRSITYTTTDSEGNTSTASGNCTGVNIATDGTITLNVGGAEVATSAITAVSEATANSSTTE